MTNWFEQYYPELISFAQKKIKERNLLNADPIEVVNDAYISFVESGEDFSIVSVRKIVADLIYKYVSERCRERAIGESDRGNGYIKRYSKKVIEIRGHKVCKRCKDPFPVGSFRLQRHDGYTILHPYCRDCQNKIRCEWFKNNRDIWNKYMIERRARLPKKPKKKAQPIQSLWNKANKKRYAKEKELLLDSYVRRILKAGKKPCSPEDIRIKREELFQKRRNKVAA